MIISQQTGESALNRYEVFSKVIECGSFTKAAAELGYTQSAVSQMVHTLEEELCSVLVLREKGGVILTSDGAQYMPYITAICSACRDLRVKHDEVQGLSGGSIRIGTFTSVSRSWLPRLMSEFKQIYPSVHFELQQGDYREIERWTSGGAVDFGFTCYGEINGLVVTPLRRDVMFAAVPADHPLAAKSSVTLEEMAAEHFILLDEGEWSAAMEAFKKRGLKPDIQYTVCDDYTVISMVEQGLGVSMLYEAVLASAGPRLRTLPVTPPPERTTALVCRNKRTLSAAAKRFVDYVLDYFKKGGGAA